MAETNYRKIMLRNLDRLYMKLPGDLPDKLAARRFGDDFHFDAFGEKCRIHPDGISLGGMEEDGPRGVVVSLYALHAVCEPCLHDPPVSFRDLPGSAPYVGAFKNRTENLLTPFVEDIARDRSRLSAGLAGEPAPEGVSSTADFSLRVHPLPKVGLTYLFYMPDEDFPPSVTCLFSRNAHRFMPTDALADLGEYTSRRILEILGILIG
jgi:hypothetical protein